LQIKTFLAEGMKREWKDEPEKPLEHCLPDILATLALAAPILVKRRQEREDAEKRRREEEHRRYLEERNREQDQNRWRRFLQLARQSNQAASARRLMAELETRLRTKTRLLEI